MLVDLKRALILAVIGLVSIGSAAEESAMRLDKLLRASRLKADEVGASVHRLEKGQWSEVWSHRSGESMIPASLTKLLTASAILQALGPSRKLETRLLATSRPENGKLNGDLYIQGGGDPGFVSETMWFLVNELMRTGVKEISGQLVVDSERFDKVKTDETRQEERVDRAFDAPVGATSFNWNSVNVFVRPALRTGEKATVILDPISTFVDLAGEVQTVAGTGTDVQIERIENGALGDRIKVRGKIGVDAKEYVAYKNISEPSQWAGANLIGFLKQRGISISGKVVEGKVPEKAILLAKADSKTVASMVTDMMKFSNNFVAEMLVKNLAAESGERPATLATGIRRVIGILGDIGLPESVFTYKSPSGFSRENRIAPKNLELLLRNIHDSAKSYPEFAASLPIGGVDGTLKSRMKTLSSTAQIRAKTGLLNGVVGLGGYATNAKGVQYTFVFLFNGRASFGEEARQVFDRLATALVE